MKVLQREYRPYQLLERRQLFLRARELRHLLIRIFLLTGSSASPIFSTGFEESVVSSKYSFLSSCPSPLSVEKTSPYLDKKMRISLVKIKSEFFGDISRNFGIIHMACRIVRTISPQWDIISRMSVSGPSNNGVISADYLADGIVEGEIFSIVIELKNFSYIIIGCIDVPTRLLAGL